MYVVDYEYYILNPIVLDKKKKLDWSNLWINKINYISNYYKNIKGKYAIIDDSIDYYICMSEVAIYYLKKYDNYYDNAFVQHKLIFKSSFFDRLFLKEDLKERDFAEYIKYLFLSQDYDVNYIYSLIKKSIGNFNYDLVIARLLFPSYYFYYLEKIIVDGEDYEKLENLVKSSGKYEKYLIDIVNKINQYSTKKIILPF